jgi:hypothetical protein
VFIFQLVFVLLSLFHLVIKLVFILQLVFILVFVLKLLFILQPVAMLVFKLVFILVFIFLKEHNVEAQRKLLTSSDSSWQEYWDHRRITGGYVVYYMGGLGDHSSYMADPLAIGSAESEYNESYLSW